MKLYELIVWDHNYQILAMYATYDINKLKQYYDSWQTGNCYVEVRVDGVTLSILEAIEVLE